ncbi:MAG: Mth938-like domain-containing protein, partial [Pseudomonadota bacterium]
ERAAGGRGKGRDLSAHPDEEDVDVEVMSTPSACRTYNVLLAEGRRVAVALVAI